MASRMLFLQPVLLPTAGTNACYVETASRVKTLPEGYNSESELMCINTEWGNFGAPCLPRLEEDLCAFASLHAIIADAPAACTSRQEMHAAACLQYGN
jgi:Hexokinase